MISTTTPPVTVDIDAQRRRVLAKVYGLLISLAEEHNDGGNRLKTFYNQPDLTKGDASITGSAKSNQG